jgi:cytoskeletal protein RodZ
MNELFKKYKIEEIAKKTSISPLFLKKLRDGDFNKISRVKFNGFIKILQSEYPGINFSSLKESYDNYYHNENLDNLADNKQNEDELNLDLDLSLIHI